MSKSLTTEFLVSLEMISFRNVFRFHFFLLTKELLCVFKKSSIDIVQLLINANFESGK